MSICWNRFLCGLASGGKFVTVADMNALHIVCGPPGAGKTTFATKLAADRGAVLLDSDQVAQRLVRAGLGLAGMDPDDRDSPAYKAAYREPVYETLWDLAVINGRHLPVVVAGPFTRECGDVSWPEKIAARTGMPVEIWFMHCAEETRRQRIAARGEARDTSKLDDWENYRGTCHGDVPVFDCHVVDGTTL